MIYSALAKGGYKVPGYYDPDELRNVGVIFRPDTWAASTVYYRGSDDSYSTVIPTTFTGVYYKVLTPGKSGATEPVWDLLDGGITTDGTQGLTWETVNYNLMVPGETIASVTVTPTHSVPVTNISHTNTACQFLIGALPDRTITEFQVTVHAVMSDTSAQDITLLFKVADR